MKVITAHRKRIADLRAALNGQIARHLRLYDLRSKSWAEQNSPDPEREHILVEMHQEIDVLEAEIERMDGVWHKTATAASEAE
jgi:hypothetical protein